jgi:hypothetical protein
MKQIVILILLAFVTQLAVAQKLGTYEYQGLRIGMTREQALAALKPYHKQIASMENHATGQPNLVAEDYGGNIQTTVTFAKGTDSVSSVMVWDKTDPFGVFTVKSRLKYGTPNRENSESKLQWQIRVPQGCGPKVACTHWEFFEFSLDGGDGRMSLMGGFR